MEEIDKLTAACANKKIKPTNLDSLSKFLKKEVGNANMNVGIAAIKAATAIATGMRKGF